MSLAIVISFGIGYAIKVRIEKDSVVYTVSSLHGCTHVYVSWYRLKNGYATMLRVLYGFCTENIAPAWRTIAKYRIVHINPLDLQSKRFGQRKGLLQR